MTKPHFRGVAFVEVRQFFTGDHLRFLHEAMQGCDQLVLYLKGVSEQHAKTLQSLALSLNKVNIRFFESDAAVKEILGEGAYDVRFVPKSRLGQAFIAYDAPIKVQFIHDYETPTNKVKLDIVADHLLEHAQKSLKPYMDNLLEVVKPLEEQE